MNRNWFNEPFAVSLIKFVLRHAWLNLWDKHMTTGRINQVAIATWTFPLEGTGQSRALRNFLREDTPKHASLPQFYHWICTHRDLLRPRLPRYFFLVQELPERSPSHHTRAVPCVLGNWASTNICMPLTTKLASLASEVSASRRLYRSLKKSVTF